MASRKVDLTQFVSDLRISFIDRLDTEQESEVVRVVITAFDAALARVAVDHLAGIPVPSQPPRPATKLRRRTARKTDSAEQSTAAGA